MQDKLAIIRKEDGEFCVHSPTNEKWNGGCYKTKEEAEKRLKQIEYFKSKGASSLSHRVVARWLTRSV